MLNHTRPQSPLAAHRGLGASLLSHLFVADVVRRRTLGVAPGALRPGSLDRRLARPARLPA